MSTSYCQDPVTDRELTDEQRRLVTDHLRLAQALSRRFRFRGESSEDLEQVALLALVKAARRFDPERNVKFSTFATSSVIGELKRHLRDRTWGVQVKRPVKEAALEVYKAREVLEQELARCPTTAELSRHLCFGEEKVLEALHAGQARALASLDRPVVEDGTALSETLRGDDDPYGDDPYSGVLDRHRLRQLLPTLASHEQHVIKRCFLDEWTQQRVAVELDVSQMQVSRTLSRALRYLRELW